MSPSVRKARSTEAETGTESARANLRQPAQGGWLGALPAQPARAVRQAPRPRPAGLDWMAEWLSKPSQS